MKNNRYVHSVTSQWHNFIKIYHSVCDICFVVQVLRCVTKQFHKMQQGSRQAQNCHTEIRTASLDLYRSN